MREWDKYDTYLFDIDGTLLVCHDAVHYFGFCEVLSSVAGRPVNLDGVTTQGNVDVGILRDALALAGIEEGAWRPHLDAMRNQLCCYVENNADTFRIEVLPGVREVLAHLRAKGSTLGVATGNLERIGWAKLASCGLSEFFDFGAFSDLCETRTQVFAGALARGRGTVCVIGDTPADVRAAHANRIDVIAVATGTHSYKELEASGPDRLVRSLTDLLIDSAQLT